MSSFQIHTFGCKVNSYDSSLLEKAMETKGFFLDELPKIHILNTCAVTAEATHAARKQIRKLKRDQSDALVVVTGCAAQVDTDKLDAVKEADIIIANSHKQQLPEIISKHLKGENTERIYKSNIFKKEDFEPGGGTESSKTRTFLKIQDGCNSFCTYCVIPFARGKSRSLSIEALTARVNELHESGYEEVVLTGVHIGDYEFGLENLVEAVLANTKIPRIRLTSLEPVEVTERLLKLYANDRLCPHFHMSIQSATTSVLKNMKRQYTAEDVERSLLAIKKYVPDAFVGMDVIVGFPMESQDDFSETYQRLAELPWNRIHVFPYSERPGTYAQRLKEKNDSRTIKLRSEHLRQLSQERMLETAKMQLGKQKSVLFLNKKGAQGLSRDYWNVYLEESDISVNKEAKVIIDGFKTLPSRMDPVLTGKLI